LACFIQKGEPGARHDFLNHQNYVEDYNDYLKVKKEDKLYDPNLEIKYFDLIADKGILFIIFRRIF
jgi:hypothetical protein